MPLLVSSTLLFYIGMAFAYFVVFPLAFGFLTHAAPEGVQVSTDIRSYLDFVMALFIAFGVSFEVPVAIVLLCWMGVTTPDDLRKKRPYVLVGAFVVGMLLTRRTCSRKRCWRFRCTVCLRSGSSSRGSTPVNA
jgi:sec-independent protein translocase protein TatC